MTREKDNQSLPKKTKFIMKGNPFGHYKNQTSVEFKLAKNHPLAMGKSDIVTFPIYNKDNRFYTPAFILPKFEFHFVKREVYLQLHNEKVKQLLEEINECQILVPKPKGKNPYCGVCKVKYEDYIQHVESDAHLTHLSNSTFQKQIKNLCYQFQIKFLAPETQQIQKPNLKESKVNDDQNSTQSFIEQKSISV